MENPATWGPAEKILSGVLDEHHRLMREEPGFCGLSLERRLADALRKAGLLLADPASLDDDQLDDLVRDLDERMDAAIRENNRRAAEKLLVFPVREPRVLRDVKLVSWGPVLDPPWPEPLVPGQAWDEDISEGPSEGNQP
jgi:hypothetical protein